jgi:hypothetical protein
LKTKQVHYKNLKPPLAMNLAPRSFRQLELRVRQQPFSFFYYLEAISKMKK